MEKGICMCRSVQLLCIVILIVQSQGSSCNYADDCCCGQNCCDYKCVTGSCSYGQHCIADGQCGSSMACCARKCVYGSDCSGETCSDSTDCSSDEFCCNGICQDDECNDNDDYSSVAIIAVSVVGGFIFLSCICCCLYFACRSRRNPGRIVSNRRVIRTTTASYGTQPCPPQAQHYPGQGPPGYYSQGYPPHPPAQYGPQSMGYQSQHPVPGQQSDAPPAYTDVISAGSASTRHQSYGATDVPYPEPSSLNA